MPTPSVGSGKKSNRPPVRPAPVVGSGKKTGGVRRPAPQVGSVKKSNRR